MKLNTYFKNIKQQNVLLHKGLAVQLSYTFLWHFFLYTYSTSDPGPANYEPQHWWKISCFSNSNIKAPFFFILDTGLKVDDGCQLLCFRQCCGAGHF